MARKAPSKLARIVSALRRNYGDAKGPPAKTAFELVLWEKVAYLATDERRAKAFKILRRRIGLTPNAILRAEPELLREIFAEGGKVAVNDRVKHTQDAAALVMDEYEGSLDTVLSLPIAAAKKALQRIYGIGDPGAERILLLTRSHQLLPLDSNGARTLLRIGYGTDDRNYSRMYRSVRDSAAAEVVRDYDWLIDAHLLLQRHGREICKTSSPRCEICVVRNECAYYAARK